MHPRPLPLIAVGIAAALAAVPLAILASDMKFNFASVAMSMAAGGSAAFWLWLFARLKLVRGLSFGVGALVGILSLGVVLCAFLLQSWPLHPPSWRIYFAGWVRRAPLK